jgi:hypothetical protein
MPHDVWVELGQKRNEVTPHGGAEIARVDVRRIVREGDVVPVDVEENVLASRAQHGAHDGDLGVGSVLGGGRRCMCSWRQNSETAHPGASEQTHEECLCAIIGMVRRRDRRAATPRRDDERIPPELARTCLQVPPSRYRYARAFEWDAGPCRECLCKIELVCRRGTKTMIDAVREDRETELWPDARDDGQQRHRVGAAADGNEERCAGRQCALPHQRATHDRRERCPLGRRLRELHRHAELVRCSRTITVSTWLV